MRAAKPTRSLQTASLLSYFGAALLLYAPLLANAQAFEQNGQFFTKGLAIIDAPAPNSQQHTGSNIVLAVDLSGDGKIPQSSFVPGSGADTRYDFLEIYLVSSQANFTIANGSGILSQEPGSTVKHLNFPLPACVNPGTYNLTFYESSHINGSAFFSITPLSVDVLSSSPSSDNSQCQSISNSVQQQPQIDSAPSVNPIKGSGPLTTITVKSSLPSAWSIEPSGTDSVPLTTVTAIMMTPETIITTNNLGSTITTTAFETSTVTMVMPTSAITAGGFFSPVNEAIHISPRSLLVTILLCLPSFFIAFAW